MAATDAAVTAPNRILWIDTAKGLAMFLVVYGHLLYGGTWDILNRAIYSFHMPMFFILSGWVLCLKPDGTHLFEFIKSRAQRLLLPSLFFVLMMLPLYVYRALFSDSFSLLKSISEFLYFKGITVTGNAPVWFFICLFQVLVVSKLLNIYFWQAYQKITGACCAFFIGWIIYRYCDIPYFGINKAVLAFGFFVTGSVLFDAAKQLPQKWLAAACIVAVPMWYISGVILNTKVSMYGFNLGTYWLFVTSGICGSVVWFGLCRLLENIPLFIKWGGGTVFIVGTHYIGAIILQRVAVLIGIYKTLTYDIAALLATFCVLMMYIPICSFVNEKFPVLNGGKLKK